MKFIKQCSFVLMLLVSAVLVYAVSFAGIRSGKLKKDISWTHPVFVSLFTHEVNDTADGTGRKDDINSINGRNDGSQPSEVPEQTKKDDDGEDHEKLPVEDNDEADNNGAGNETKDSIAEDGSRRDDISSDTDSDDTDSMPDTDNEDDAGKNVYTDSQYSGQVEYVTIDMRHARSGYYSDFDKIALSSKLDYVQVDNDYFSDACFIGDSRMEGLYFYGDLREADFYYKPGVTVYDIMNRKLLCNGEGAEEITGYLSRKQYAHIYTMVGVNELGDKNPEEYAKAYSDDIQMIRKLQPDAIIFIIGMMHVTTAYSDASDVFNNDNIDARNTAVAGIANGKDIFYLDMNESVDDGRGGVVGDYSYDGVHLKAEYYKLWTEWMKAHGIKNLIK